MTSDYNGTDITNQVQGMQFQAPAPYTATDGPYTGQTVCVNEGN